ncbi:MAG: NBR1-Ig-like domain-containing protein [Oryzihumus sp.]
MRSAASARAEAIEGFAAVLAELRASVGCPSFRVMAGRSRAISHTTLHEAVQGNRLPSWGTTAEFVKACGADPAAFRQRWEEANRVVCPVAVAAVVAQQAAAPADPDPGPASSSANAATPAPSAAAPSRPVTRSQAPPPTSPDSTAVSATPAARQGRRRRRAVLGSTVALALTVGAVTAWTTAGGRGRPPSGAAGYKASDCPVQQPNPPAEPPVHLGDHAVLVADVTYPDCDHVRAGQVFKKVWRIKNAGAVAWRGYALHRLDVPQRRDQCQTITDVTIPETDPGQQVDVSVEVTAPPTPGFCFVRFKLVDAAGRVAFPGSRPVNFQLIVD